jgi:hypothetical protein
MDTHKLGEIVMVDVREASDTVSQCLKIIRANLSARMSQERTEAVLDAAGALASYAKSLEGMIAKQDHRAAVAILERQTDNEEQVQAA